MTAVYPLLLVLPMLHAAIFVLAFGADGVEAGRSRAMGQVDDCSLGALPRA